MKNLRWREYLVLLYRILLVYVFYFVARCLFLFFQKETMGDLSFALISKLFYYGIAFDTTAILYVNLLFILLSILPLWINTQAYYQRIVFYTYFITNTLAYATNFIDMVYYPFSKSRLTTASMAVVENEQNKGTFFLTFLTMYWYMLVLFAVLIWIWIFLYKKIKIHPQKVEKTSTYLITSLIGFLIIGLGTLAGIRGGDLATATRPINILDASRHVTLSAHADAILNTPFTLIRTIGKNKGFKEYQFVTQQYIEENIHPIKNYTRVVETKPNVVIFILESFGREYWGSMNTERKIPDFLSYTPFLDSLAQHSAVFDNAYANGRQSIHGMSSILAGIPTFQVAYTSSPFVKQPTQSIVSICNEMGYDTSFFHSAPNGSMGFLGFSNILGFNHYYGKNEYNNEADYDGIWGIWDEPFFQFMNRTICTKKQPFMATIFTLSSHHPFKVPKQYEGKFDKGHLDIHQCIGYTDYALKQFFQSAQKEDWFTNTIFVFTADHTNQVYYNAYKQPITGTGVPIMFYSPNADLVPKGISHQIAQQIDIYPTLVDLLGYEKPFRSWGRSLFSDKEPPRAYISNDKFYQLMQGNYIQIMNTDGQLNGIYRIDDEALKNNLLDKEINTEIDKTTTDLRAFMQDYMYRIINKKLQ
ncbi:LTA synthase family protein [Capnocytophaga catalasegens]|nr:alkaline phosphatase family protein [Capnocytophaga catalasegens]